MVRVDLRRGQRDQFVGDAACRIEKNALLALDTLALAAAMAALGMETRFAKLRALGPKPLLLAAMLWVWLIGAGLVLVKFVI